MIEGETNNQAPPETEPKNEEGKMDSGFRRNDDSPPPRHSGLEPESILNDGKEGDKEADNRLELPKDPEDKEGYDKLYKALGRPDSVEGYELNTVVEKVDDPAFFEAAGKMMYEAGLSATQARKLAGAYEELRAATATAIEEKYQAELAEAQKALPLETVENARRGFRLFGLAGDEAQKVGRAIEGVLGVKAAAEFFAKIGKKIGEDAPVDGARPGGPAAGDPAKILYPDQA
jgi:hypothetical protein